MSVTDKHAFDVTGTLAGTPVYIAPEIFRSEIYEFSADIYSLGIILWEMWYGQTPFTNIKFKNWKEFGKLVNEGRHPEHNLSDLQIITTSAGDFILPGKR